MIEAVIHPHVHVNLEYVPSSSCETKVDLAQDPFRHASLANSHNHHKLHPWGNRVLIGTKEFDALYSQANNQYMYHLWYTPALDPFMATKVVKVELLSAELLKLLNDVLHMVLEAGIDTAMKSAKGQELIARTQSIIDGTGLTLEDRIFVRLGATSLKDSFAADVPTTKPTPLPPAADPLLRRMLTSARSVGRLLALNDQIWPSDPGEALIIQLWSPEIELRREFRAFCHQGRVTAISQDIWWERLGWREDYSEGFVDAIMELWDNVKTLIPFDTCTMDVLMRKETDTTPKWNASLIEFNGFGAHLNTGSDLFHWVNDADILYGRKEGITLRFVDDWEGKGVKSHEAIPNRSLAEQGEQEMDLDPDWLVLEKKLRDVYSEKKEDRDKISSIGGNKLPLRGRWCSAY